MGGEWKRVQFSDAVWVNPPVPLKRGENYPFVEMQNVNPSERAARSKQSRPFTGGGARFAAGDTLMARITPCLENGKTARFVSEDDQAIAHGSTEFIVIRGRPGVSDTNFAYYLTRWREVQDFAISQMTGTSGRQRVPTEALSHLTVPLPPLPEQKAIASVLGALDDKIELNRRTNETLETMARAVFKSWFVDFDPVHAKSKDLQPDGMDADTAKLFPSSFVDFEIGRVPKGWKVVPIYEIADVIYGAPFSSALFNDKEGGRPLIRIRDLPKECPGVWTPEVHPKGYLVHAGDVVVGVNGRPISSAADIAAQFRPGARLSFEVERGGSKVPIALNLEQ